MNAMTQETEEVRSAAEGHQGVDEGRGHVEEKSAYLLIAELSSSRRRASLVEVLSSFDRLSILFRITSSMSLIFFSTPRDSTPPST